MRPGLTKLVSHAAVGALKARGFRSRHVPTPSGSVHLWEARGAGPLPPLVLIHGLSGAGVHYYPFLRGVRRAVRHLVAVDLPGHGLSDVPAKGLTPDTIREAVYGAFDAVLTRHEKPILFGNSLGGLVALRYALMHPERVGGLVLFSPAGAPMSEPELDWLRRSFQLGSHGDALEFVDRLSARPGALRHLLALGVREAFEPAHIQQLVSHLSAGELFHEAELAGLSVPTLLLWGRQDRVLPMSCFEFFRQALPGHARVELYDGVGHTPFLERAASVAERTVAFLEELHHPRIERVPAVQRRSA